MSLLSVEGLVKNYGRRRVVDGVDFHVEAGEIVGLLGPNGAGKTTSFRMTCGIVIPDSGRVLLDDEEITDWPMYKRARDGGMGYLAQEQSVFRKLTVEQNLLAIMELIGMAPKVRRKRCEELLEQFDIVKIRRSKAHYILGGREAAARDRPLPGDRAADHPARRAVHWHRPGDDPLDPEGHSLDLRDDRHLDPDHRPPRAGDAGDHRPQLRRPCRQGALPRHRRRKCSTNPDAKKYYFGESPGVTAA